MALVLRGVTHQFGETKIFEKLDLEVGEGCFCCIVGPSGCGKSTLLRIISGLYKPVDGEVLLDNAPPSLEKLDLEVGEGCFCCIVGPSGCGKSTLLRIISGLYKPVDGEVLLDNAPPSLEKGEIGFVFQEDALFPWFTVEENIKFALRARNIDKKIWNETVEYNLRKVGLAEYRRYYPMQLSGGMKQRVAIARVLAYNPKLLLMDEPFASLDSLNRNRLQAELIDLWYREKKTILFVTHNIDEAVFLAERVFIMGVRPGRIEEVLDIDLPQPRNRTGADFCRYRRQILDMIEVL